MVRNPVSLEDYKYMYIRGKLWLNHLSCAVKIGGPGLHGRQSEYPRNSYICKKDWYKSSLLHAHVSIRILRLSDEMAIVVY